MHAELVLVAFDRRDFDVMNKSGLNVEESVRCCSNIVNDTVRRTRFSYRHPSPNSCRAEMTLRLTWLVKLSKTDRSLPSSQVKIISHGVSTFEQHSIEQRSTGGSWSALTAAESLFLRAARDQVLPQTCTNIIVEEPSGVAEVIDVTNRSSTVARTFREALSKM